MRNIYSPDVACANELFIDQLAKKVGKDPLAFRLGFLRNERVKACLRKVAEVGQWGRGMPAGTAQGIAVHKEYKGATAVLVEIDCRPETVDRQIRDAVTGPRVTKAVIAVDVGLVVNPRGLEAQMQGGVNDGIALALTSSHHLATATSSRPAGTTTSTRASGTSRPTFEVHRHALGCGQPGGAGEAGVAALRRGHRLCLRPGDGHRADRVPDQPRHRVVHAQVLRPTGAAVAHRRPGPHLLRSTPMPQHTFR